jgi:molybdenum cofactor synthesis domain-containing protein
MKKIILRQKIAGQKNPKAAMIIIGDEILSGRTHDENLNFLACILNETGVNLKEVRIIGDVEQEIIEAVNAMRKKYNYVFTSGGIGPTHDDITSAAIAMAFNDQLVKNQDALNLLRKYYGKVNVNEARLKMAFMPGKARLISGDNIISPSGFYIENVFVLAGIPKIFRLGLDNIKKEIIGGKKTKTREIKISLTESTIAGDFAKLQQKYSEVAMGSYPSDNSTSLVFRSIDYDILEQSVKEMIAILKKIKSDSIIAVN